MIATTHATLKPVRTGRVTAWTLPDPLVGPRDVLVSSDGAVWVTEQNRGRVARLDGTMLTGYSTDAFPYMGAFALSPGPGGTVWFSGYPGGSVGRILPDGSANGFAPLADGATTVGIALGPGGSMWITDQSRPVLERIGSDATVSELVVPPAPGSAQKDVQLRDIAQGADGAMWFTDLGTGSVGSVSAGGTPAIVEHPLGHGAKPRSIALSPDGTLWVTLTNQRALAKIDPEDGAATLVPLPAADATLNDLLVSPDGTIWVSEEGSFLLHVRTDGSLIERIELPAGVHYADGLARASDGTVWAAATDANMLVEVAPSH